MSTTNIYEWYGLLAANILLLQQDFILSQIESLLDEGM